MGRNKWRWLIPVGLGLAESALADLFRLTGRANVALFAFTTACYVGGYVRGRTDG
jgi:hypothetical protein